MSAQIDFLALYRELGIDPTCSPEAFKHAYRRRVSELHPDRGSEGHAGEEALKVLNLGYAAALEFFQAHGRFPGAPPAPAAARRPAPAPSAGAAATARPPRRDAGTAPPAGVAASATTAPGQRRWLSGVLVALVALGRAAQLAGRGDEGTAAPADAARAGAAAPDADDTAAGAVPALWIGMSAREALDALGTPTDTTEDGRLWHYGPSWIRLSCREVVDWYSSPLKPLGHSPMHPDGDPDPLDAERGIACLELDPAAHR